MISTSLSFVENFNSIQRFIVEVTTQRSVTNDQLVNTSYQTKNTTPQTINSTVMLNKTTTNETNGEHLLYRTMEDILYTENNFILILINSYKCKKNNNYFIFKS